MEILVIGGSRFVGPYVVNSLLRGGHKVSIFNRGKIQSHYNKNVDFIKGDRNNELKIKKHFDVVIDTIAYSRSQTQKAIEQLDFDFFLHFSTAAVYKKTEVFPLTEDSPIGKWPLWGEYNEGKVECEQALKKSGVKYAAIRPVYILGPRNYIDREYFIYSRIKTNTPISVPGNGEAIVQFVFAKDVAASIVLLVTSKQQGVFNCAGDEMITLNGLVSEMGKLVGKKPVVKYNQNPNQEKWDEAEFPFANENFFCKNEKLKKMGIRFTPFLAGLKEDFNSYYKKQI